MKVLLISMPFANPKTPSLALSQLKPCLINLGISCDIKYLNLEFRNYCGKADYFDNVSSLWNIGEWVFKNEIYENHNTEKEINTIYETLDLDNEKSIEIIKQLKYLRTKASGFIKYYMNDLDLQPYEVIGFTTVFAQNIASLALAKEIKKLYPKKIIAFGGSNCFGKMGKTLITNFSFIDWVFTGESELSFPTMLQNYITNKSYDNIDGVYYRTEYKQIKGNSNNMTPDLDSLDNPDYNDFIRQIKDLCPSLEDKLQITFEMSRGCWWADRSKCIFCGLNSENTHYREKSKTKILHEINELHKISKSRIIRAVDNNIPQKIYTEILPNIEKYKFKEIFVEVMASIKKENLLALKKAGTNRFQPGIESLDNNLLRHIKKGTSLLHNIQLLKWSRELNMEIEWNFIHNFPNENSDSYLQIAKISPSLSHLTPTDRIGPVILQRFSPLFNNPSQFDITEIKVNQVYKTFYNMEDSELSDFVYTFNYKHSFSVEHNSAVNKACNALKEWSSLWKENKEPPFLAYLKQNHEKIQIFDTRPCRTYHNKILNTLESKIILLSDKIISKSIISQLCLDFNEDEVSKTITSLEDQRLIISDNSRILSLVCNIKLMAENGGSMLAKMLV